VNWLAIIIAALANMVIGFLWYGTWAFGKSWMKLSGHVMGEGFPAGPGPLYAMTAVAAVVQAITMAWLIGQTGANSGAAGAIVAGYSVLALVVQGMIIGFLGA
jgi:hypothetical protein